jgi:hypothetical protein
MTKLKILKFGDWFCRLCLPFQIRTEEGILFVELFRSTDTDEWQSDDRGLDIQTCDLKYGKESEQGLNTR